MKNSTKLISTVVGAFSAVLAVAGDLQGAWAIQPMDVEVKDGPRTATPTTQTGPRTPRAADGGGEVAHTGANDRVVSTLKRKRGEGTSGHDSSLHGRVVPLPKRPRLARVTMNIDGGGGGRNPMAHIRRESTTAIELPEEATTLAVPALKNGYVTYTVPGGAPLEMRYPFQGLTTASNAVLSSDAVAQAAEAAMNGPVTQTVPGGVAFGTAGAMGLNSAAIYSATGMGTTMLPAESGTQAAEAAMNGQVTCAAPQGTPSGGGGDPALCQQIIDFFESERQKKEAASAVMTARRDHSSTVSDTTMDVDEEEETESSGGGVVSTTTAASQQAARAPVSADVFLNVDVNQLNKLEYFAWRFPWFKVPSRFVPRDDDLGPEWLIRVLQQIEEENQPFLPANVALLAQEMENAPYFTVALAFNRRFFLPHNLRDSEGDENESVDSDDKYLSLPLRRSKVVEFLRMYHPADLVKAGPAIARNVKTLDRIVNSL